MAKYKIWDQESNIYTPVGEELTPDQWKARYGWIRIPGAKMVISDGLINGAFVAEFTSFVETYVRMGVEFTEGMSDQDKLDAIAAFEEAPVVNVVASADERIAAEMEYNTIVAMMTNEEEGETISDVRYIKNNYDRKMVGWTNAFIKKMVAANLITEEQFAEITGSEYTA